MLGVGCFGEGGGGGVSGPSRTVLIWVQPETGPREAPLGVRGEPGRPGVCVSVPPKPPPRVRGKPNIHHARRERDFISLHRPG